MNSNSDKELLRVTLHVTQKESQHLLAVYARFFPQEELNTQWLKATLNTPEGIDRLESFSSKFSRLQDAILDKLLPRFLRAAGELAGSSSVIDNLNKAERLKLIDNSDQWISMRRLRNALVHEYFDDPSDMLEALKSAQAFTHILVQCQKKIQHHSLTQLAIAL